MRCRFVAFLLWSACQTCRSVKWYGDDHPVNDDVKDYEFDNDKGDNQPVDNDVEEFYDVENDNEGFYDVDNDNEGTKTNADGFLLPRGKIEITLLLTRHALSCANIANDYSTRYGKDLAHLIILDPPLSECGKYRSRRLREPIKKALRAKNYADVSLVLASHLLRAQQTAGYMYGVDKQIMVTPYISEAGPGLDNQQRVRGADEKEHYLDENFLDNLPKDARSSTTLLNRLFNTSRWLLRGHEGKMVYGNIKPDWGKFEKFMGERLLPTMFDKRRIEGDRVTIAVVSHSHFMAEPEVCNRKPRNNEIFVLRYHYDAYKEPRSGSFERQRQTDDTVDCTSLELGVPIPDAPLTTTYENYQLKTLHKHAKTFGKRAYNTIKNIGKKKQNNSNASGKSDGFGSNLNTFFGSRRALCHEEGWGWLDDIGCKDIIKTAVQHDTKQSLLDFGLSARECCTAFDPDERAPDEEDVTIRAGKTAADLYNEISAPGQNGTPIELSPLVHWRLRFGDYDDVDEKLSDTLKRNIRKHVLTRKNLGNVVRKVVARLVRTH